MTAPELFNSSKQQMRLGTVIGKGGEGAVYQLSNEKGLVAKVYHSPLSFERAEKLRIMTSLRNEAIDKLAAWPRDILMKRDGKVVGFTMRSITQHKDIHHVYSPKSRRASFARADWRFLIRVGANVARAFGVVHNTGCVIGDVNHGGILVAQDATVKLIDCDSFQLSARGKKFLCEVGTETFTPPELQGRSFSNTVRTTNHDSFGLAVVVFQLLFMGRHPFAGKFATNRDMPIAKAIEEVRFPYGSRHSLVQMERPPGTPPLSNVGDEVAFLFERAFAKEMVGGGRPDAAEWVSALEKLEKRTKQCSASASHWYLSSLPRCPWCEMEAKTGVSLFAFHMAQTPGSSFDLDSLWRQLASIPHPGPLPSFQTVRPTASRDAQAIRGWKSNNHLLALLAGALPLIGVVAFPPAFFVFMFLAWIIYASVKGSVKEPPALQEFRRKRDATATQWQAALNHWKVHAGPELFDRKKNELEGLRVEWSNLPNIRLRKLNALNASQRQIQLDEFLDRFEIDDAKIEGIGPGRKQTLRSYGIETAADITRSAIGRVPGFGQSLSSRLYAWRNQCEAKFKFNPNKPIDQRHVAKIEQDILIERKRLEDRIKTTFAEYKHLSSQILLSRQHLKPQVEQAYAIHAQAVVDYETANS